MKKNLIIALAAMAMLAVSCSKNPDLIQPETAPLSTTGTASLSTSGMASLSTVGNAAAFGGPIVLTTRISQFRLPIAPVPTTVISYTGVFPLPVPGATNKPITDAGPVLPTSTWAIKFTVNGVAITTYNNVPFRFDLDPVGGWKTTAAAGAHGGRNPVGFWYSFPPISLGLNNLKGSMWLSYPSIDTSFAPLNGYYLLNPASTENTVILDRYIGGDGHITLHR
jgi:hypothetical protein